MTRRGFPPGLPGGLPTGLVEDALRGLVGAVREAVPLDAQLHLLAAQRELILAVAAVIEHRGQGSPQGSREDGAADPSTSVPAGRHKGRGPAAAPAGRARPGASASRARRPTRVSLD